MSTDPGRELIPVAIERVLLLRDSAAVVVEAPEKKFFIFVGLPEAHALQREIDGEKTERPLTHDVITYLMCGFDIVCRRVVISSIVNNVFCATLVAERAGESGPGAQPVSLDLRASDAMVIAMKTQTQLEVARRVLDAVEDVTPTLEQLRQAFGEGEGESEDEGPSESEEEF